MCSRITIAETFFGQLIAKWGFCSATIKFCNYCVSPHDGSPTPFFMGFTCFCRGWSVCPPENKIMVDYHERPQRKLGGKPPSLYKKTVYGLKNGILSVPTLSTLLGPPQIVPIAIAMIFRM